MLVLAGVIIAGAALGATLDADPDPAGQARARLSSPGNTGPRSVLSSVPSSNASLPCGAASASAIAGVDATVARAIYTAEIHSSEVRADITHVIGSGLS